MPDNWTFVAAAYGLAAVVFGGYWRWLARKEREIRTFSRVDTTLRSRQPSTAGHPRVEPASRGPLQS
jgi:hypothetical protein